MGATRDIRNQLKPILSLEPQVINTNTTTVGEIIDMADYNKGITFALSQAVTAAGTLTPLLEESVDPAFATSNEIDDIYLVGDVETGQEADSALTATQDISSIGAVGNPKRYIRLSIVSTDSPNVIASVVALATPDVVPISN